MLPPLSLDFVFSLLTDDNNKVHHLHYNTVCCQSSFVCFLYEVEMFCSGVRGWIHELYSVLQNNPETNSSEKLPKIGLLWNISLADFHCP